MVSLPKLQHGAVFTWKTLWPSTCCSYERQHHTRVDVLRTVLEWVDGASENHAVADGYGGEPEANNRMNDGADFG